MGGPLLLVLGVVLTAAGATASTSLLRPESRLDAAVTLGVTASAGVAAALLAAGVPGLLRPEVVLTLLGLWAVVAGVAARRRGRFPSRAGWSTGLACWRRRPWAAALVGLAALALAWQLLVALVLPPYAYDALTYHLTTVAEWIRHGDLAPSALDLCCAYYPATPELLITFPALLLGDDALVGTVQVPFVVLGAAATAGLARSAGLSRSAAAAAGALFAVTPVVLTQAPTDYVDLMQAALVLAALHSVTRYAVGGDRNRLLVAGLAAGLVLGTKGTGPVWAVVLLVAAAVAGRIAVRRGRVRGPSAARGLAVAAVVGAVLGGWWYVRNAVTTGNPLYPFAVRLGDTTVFSGPVDVGETLTVPPAGADAPWPVTVALSWAGDLDFWNQGSYDYQQRLGGLGPLWPWLGLPLLVATVVVLVRRRDVTLLPVAAVAAVLLVQPYAWWARFTLPLAALGALAIALAATRAPWPLLRRVVQGASLVLALASVALSSYAVDPAGRAAPLPASDVLALVGASGEERSVGRLFHPEYAFLSEVPEDATVVVDLRAEPVRFVYPLFGPAFTRRVVPGGDGPVPDDAWVVTSPGRALDRAASATHELVSDERDVRVWRPR
ncbi:hypothetical protein [Geodermatophilus sp. SYSU D00684]